MDQDQDNSHKESLVNLFKLPTELLVYIVSFLSLRDRVKLRYVSRWLRCVIEGTPSLWKEFVWSYYDSREECSVKEVLKVCGQHIKILSFPNCRVPSTLVEMLQYCSNVQHLSLPSTKLDREQLRNTIHMGCLQTLEVEVDCDSDIKELFLTAWNLSQLSIHVKISQHVIKILQYWAEADLRPRNLDVIESFIVDCSNIVVNNAVQLQWSTPIPTGITAKFRVYIHRRSRKIPLNFSPTFPYFQLQFEGSDQKTISCVELSEFSILGSSDDLAVMTDCQYGGRTMCLVRHEYENIASKWKTSNHIRLNNFGCVTHFDIAERHSFHSDNLKQLALTCPYLQRLNLRNCHHCLESLQGLQAIASHCHNLQGINLLGIHVSQVENHILLWEILSDMKLTHLAVQFCILRSQTANKEKLVCFYKKCLTVRGIEFHYVHNSCDSCVANEHTVPCFPSLDYCKLRANEPCIVPTIVQDVINDCKELKCVSFDLDFIKVSLGLVHNHNLQQLYIYSPATDVPDDFMTSVSAHGGLVHVVVSVRSLTFEGMISLVRNSPKLITLFVILSLYDVKDSSPDMLDTLEINATLKRMFWHRKLFRIGCYSMIRAQNTEIENVLTKQDTDLMPLWN